MCNACSQQQIILYSFSIMTTIQNCGCFYQLLHNCISKFISAYIISKHFNQIIFWCTYCHYWYVNFWWFHCSTLFGVIPFSLSIFSKRFELQSSPIASIIPRPCCPTLLASNRATNETGFSLLQQGSVRFIFNSTTACYLDQSSATYVIFDSATSAWSYSPIKCNFPSPRVIKLHIPMPL